VSEQVWAQAREQAPLREPLREQAQGLEPELARAQVPARV
jgi:hypothetical protein